MKRKVVFGVGLVVAIAVAVGIGVVKSRAGEKAFEVKTVSAKVQDINETVNVNGEIQEVESEDVYFSSPVKVNRVLVEKDQYVRKGQRLVDVDMDDLNSQLEQAKVSLNIQNISLERLRDTLKTQNTAQLQLAVEQAEYAMNQAKKTLDRTQSLYNQGASTLFEYENAKTGYENTKTQYSVAQNNLIDASNNNQSLVNGNQKDLENQSEQVRLTQLKIQDLESKIAKLNKESLCPIDGVVAELNLKSGSTTSLAGRAMQIVNTNKLEIKLDVKEIDILKVKVGQDVEITGDAFPNKTINGVVKSIGALARKKQSGSNSDESFVEVLVSVDNQTKELKPGMTVNAKIITVKKNKSVVISFDCFTEDKDGNKSVFVVENGVAKQKNITVGVSSGLNLEVTSGLNGSEKLVQDPASKLKDGMAVKSN